MASALGGSAAASLCWLGLGSVSSTRRSAPVERQSWSAFLDRAEVLATEAQRRGRQFEHDYLTELARQLAAADSPPSAAAAPGPSGVAQQPLCRRGPLIAYQYRMSSAARLPLHDHVGYNGVMRVTAGTVEVHSYELVEDRPDPGQWPLLLRQVDQAVLSPGEIGVVTLSGANLHDLRAGAGGASFVDVFTVYREPARSRQVVLGPPVADTGALRTARWGNVM